MSADNDGDGIAQGVEVKLSFEALVGKLGDTLDSLDTAAKHIHKMLEPNKSRAPIVAHLNHTITAPATALTYTFITLGGPRNGEVWGVRRYAVMGPDPFATLTGVSVIAFIAQQVPVDSNTEPPFLDIIDPFSNTVPNSASWSDGELTLLFGQKLILGLKSLANNQVIQVTAQVLRWREDSPTAGDW
jgi:hypothetical protein